MQASAVLHNAQQAQEALQALYRQVKPWLMADHKFVVTVKKKTRSIEQNSRMWAMLNEISQQVVWHGKKLTPEEWKHVFSAAMKKQDVVPGLDGGFVVLGQSTSQMTVKEMCEMQELMEAFGAQQGVRFAARVDPETGEEL